jgi:hypothetical protein
LAGSWQRGQPVEDVLAAFTALVLADLGTVTDDLPLMAW